MFRICKALAISLSVGLALAPLAIADPPRSDEPRLKITSAPVEWDHWGPGYYPHRNFAGPDNGDIKLKTDMDEADVFVNGYYAGKSGKLKRFSIGVGAHLIELRDSEGHIFFQRRVQVSAGKTTTLDLRG